MKPDFILNVHYYLENGRVVFTEKYHKERGQCCFSKCRHCPFTPKHIKGTKTLSKPTT